MTSFNSFSKYFLIAALLAVACFAAKPVFAEDELSIGDEVSINVCAAVFPCHIKTGRLLPGFSTGTECKWERTCENYRKSSSFLKLRKKLQKQKRISKRKVIEIKSRN